MYKFCHFLSKDFLYSVYRCTGISIIYSDSRPLKTNTDDGHTHVHELGSIGIFSFFTITLSNVLHLLQTFTHTVPQTTWTNIANLVTVWLYAYIVSKLYVLTYSLATIYVMYMLASVQTRLTCSLWLSVCIVCLLYVCIQCAAIRKTPLQKLYCL